MKPHDIRQTHFITQEAIAPFGSRVPSLSTSSQRSQMDTNNYLVLREQTILLEYRMLSKLAPSGVYVAPQSNNSRRWFGVLFIREGYYSGGIFKFCLQMPTSYPQHAPEFTFQSRVYHPMVDESSGRVDISLGFPNWESGKHHILAVLYFVKKIFLLKQYMELELSFNKAAAILFKSNNYEFAKKVRAFIRDSQSNQKLYKSHPDSPLKVRRDFIQFQYELPTHESIKENLLERKETTESEQVHAFKEWFLTTYLGRLSEMPESAT